MSRYFDKDFFRFFLGFVAIIFISCVVILATRLYQSELEKQPQAITNVANPKP